MPRLTAEQAKHANYVCGALALTILLIRVLATLRRRRPIDLSFHLVLASILTVIARLLVNFYYLRFGTASDAISDPDYFDNHQVVDIKTGTILSLVARILIVSQCWLQISLLLLFYSTLMTSVSWACKVIKIAWMTTATTYIAVVLATMLECQPLHLYWQISPDPGSCVKSYVQITLQCASNIALDLMLLTISWPILRVKNRSWQEQLRIGTLYLLGTFCIIVTTLRLIFIYDAGSGQATRSLWASVQMVVSTFVANTPTIYGMIRFKPKDQQSQALARRMSKPEVWPQSYDALLELPLPSRAATQSSCQSHATTVGRKEWFDHVETLETGK